MIQFLETIGVINGKRNGDFKIAPAILIMLLMIIFLGATIYILVSSLQY